GCLGRAGGALGRDLRDARARAANVHGDAVEWPAADAVGDVDLSAARLRVAHRGLAQPRGRRARVRVLHAPLRRVAAVVGAGVAVVAVDLLPLADARRAAAHRHAVVAAGRAVGRGALDADSGL